MKHTMRQGAARGTGSGYRNLRGFPRDPHIHSASAKGMKQPQTVSVNSIIADFEKRRKKTDWFAPNLLDWAGKPVKDFKVSWASKSNVGDEYPFNVNAPIKWRAEDIEIIKNPPIIKVSPSEFDNIIHEIEDFSPEFMKRVKMSPPDAFYTDKEMEQIKKQGFIGGDVSALAHQRWKKATKEKYGTTIFLINDGKRIFAVDTQGFAYPQYKSYVLPAKVG